MSTHNPALPDLTVGSDHAAAIVPVARVRLQLRFLSPGSLNRWMGPSLRGLLAKPLKDHWCVWDPFVRDEKYRHCDGCPEQAACHYARMFEPAPFTGVVKGWSTRPHAISIIPDFPAPRWVAGERDERPLGVTLLFLSQGSEVIDQTIGHLRRLGRQVGLGDDQVRFEVLPDSAHAGLEREEFDLGSRWNAILRAPAESLVPEFHVRALTPAVLKRDGQLVLWPHFFDLLAAGLRVLRQTMSASPIATGGGPVEGAELGPVEGLELERVERWKYAATGVQAAAQRWERVCVPRRSNRSGQSFGVWGVHGWATYRDVPRQLADLVQLAGQLGIGQSRVCGAGQLWASETASR